MEEWDKVIAAMKRFRYFDAWDEVAQRECCIRTKIKGFRPDETILGDGSGNLGYTYFLLKGECALVEHIFLKVQMKNGRKCYELMENGPENLVEKEAAVGKAEKISKASKASTEKKATSSLNGSGEEREFSKK